MIAMRFGLSVLLLLTIGCSGNAKSPSANQDYYRPLNQGTIVEIMGFCLRDRNDSCPGRLVALRRYNATGPEFNPHQPLTLLDWRMEQVGKSRGALQVKMKDDGLIYDTTVNIDAVVHFGAKGVRKVEIENVYGGKWAFSETFVESAVVVGAAAYVAKKGLESAPSSTPGSASAPSTSNESSCSFEVKENKGDRVRYQCHGRFPHSKGWLYYRDGFWHDEGLVVLGAARGRTLESALKKQCGC